MPFVRHCNFIHARWMAPHLSVSVVPYSTEQYTHMDELNYSIHIPCRVHPTPSSPVDAAETCSLQTDTTLLSSIDRSAFKQQDACTHFYVCTAQFILLARITDSVAPYRVRALTSTLHRQLKLTDHPRPRSALQPVATAAAEAGDTGVLRATLAAQAWDGGRLRLGRRRRLFDEVRPRHIAALVVEGHEPPAVIILQSHAFAAPMSLGSEDRVLPQQNWE